MTLHVFKDKLEYDFVVNKIRMRSNWEDSWWTGIYDLGNEYEADTPNKNRPFYSISTGYKVNYTKFFSHDDWGVDQPNNLKGNESCVDIRKAYHYYMNDFFCDYSSPFICASGSPQIKDPDSWTNDCNKSC